METWIFVVMMFTNENKFVDMSIVDNFKSEKSCVDFMKNNFSNDDFGKDLVIKEKCILKSKKRIKFPPNPLSIKK